MAELQSSYSKRLAHELGAEMRPAQYGATLYHLLQQRPDLRPQIEQCAREAAGEAPGSPLRIRSGILYDEQTFTWGAAGEAPTDISAPWFSQGVNNRSIVDTNMPGDGAFPGDVEFVGYRLGFSARLVEAPGTVSGGAVTPTPEVAALALASTLRRVAATIEAGQDSRQNLGPLAFFPGPDLVFSEIAPVLEPANAGTGVSDAFVAASARTRPEEMWELDEPLTLTKVQQWRMGAVVNGIVNGAPFADMIIAVDAILYGDYVSVVVG